MGGRPGDQPAAFSLDDDGRVSGDESEESEDSNASTKSVHSQHTVDEVDLEGHIVVLGSIHGTRSFIEPFREKQSRKEDIDALKEIVIVSPENDKASN